MRLQSGHLASGGPEQASRQRRRRTRARVSAGENQSSLRYDATGTGAGQSQPADARAAWAALTRRATGSNLAVAEDVRDVTTRSDHCFWRRGNVGSRPSGSGSDHTCRAASRGAQREAGVTSIGVTKARDGSGPIAGHQVRTLGAAAQQAAARASVAKGSVMRRPSPPRERGSVARDHDVSGSGPTTISVADRRATSRADHAGEAPTARRAKFAIGKAPQQRRRTSAMWGSGRAASAATRAAMRAATSSAHARAAVRGPQGTPRSTNASSGTSGTPGTTCTPNCSHLARLSRSPTAAHRGSATARKAATSSGGPDRKPSSRNQTSRTSGDGARRWACASTARSRRTKMAGPRTSPCCTPPADRRQCGPQKSQEDAP